MMELRMFTFEFYKYKGSKVVRKSKLYYFGDDSHEAMEWAKNVVINGGWDEVVLDSVEFKK